MERICQLYQQLQKSTLTANRRWQLSAPFTLVTIPTCVAHETQRAARRRRNRCMDCAWRQRLLRYIIAQIVRARLLYSTRFDEMWVIQFICVGDACASAWAETCETASQVARSLARRKTQIKSSQSRKRYVRHMYENFLIWSDIFHPASCSIMRKTVKRTNETKR